MKLEFDPKKIDRSEKFVEMNFAIGNVAVIMNILRSKLYPAPIKAFTQEIMSNARDAHREVGKEETPIEVKLPTSLDRTFSVRDFGPSVTPERMAEVFVQYGNSTKRSDNTQTGGFGLGAKSPWSYQDSFCIISTTTEKGKNIKRAYLAYIDESQIGKLAKTYEEETDEPQGTEIIVACKPNDESTFLSWVKTATQFWAVRPTIKGVSDMKWDTVSRTFEGDRWFIDISSRDRFGYYNRSSGPKAIVDGIPYPLNWDNLETDKMDKDAQVICQKLFYHSVYLIFDTGELSLTANREEIDYTPKSIAEIQKRLATLAKELSTQISEGIKNAKNLWEANILWNKTNNELRSLVQDSKWKTHKVTGQTPIIPSKSGVELYHYERQFSGGKTFRKRSSPYQGTFSISENMLIFINDEENATPNRRRLTTVFDKNPDVKDVYVYHCPSEAAARKAAQDALKDMEIALYVPANLTTYDKAPIVRTKTATNGTTTTTDYKVPRIWKFKVGADNKRNAWEANDDFDVEEEEGCYVLLKNRDATGAKDGKDWPIVALSEAGRILKDTEIWGISEKAIDKIDAASLIPLEDALKAKYEELSKDKDIDDYKDVTFEERLLPDNTLSAYWNKIKNIWQNEFDADGEMYKYLDFSEKIATIREKISFHNKLKKLVVDKMRPSEPYDSKYFDGRVVNGGKKGDWEKLYEKMTSTYPLLSYINGWYLERNKDYKAVIEYIQMIDEKKSPKVAVQTMKAPAVVAVSN